MMKMKNAFISIVVLVLCGTLIAEGKIIVLNKATIRSAQTAAEPWTPGQLMAPAALAAIINNPAVKKPLIICVGPGALIKGSVDVGPAKEKENLEKLRKELNVLPKNSDIVIYCGCCPFDHCPNVRPAFTLLNEMKFTNTHLLNLEHNIRTDWVDKGYPQEKS
jgi:thiosulfate/3-mercaptopyruvate sulfurtransferase